MADRTIYYLGNKARSSSVIAEICRREFGASGVAFDVFAGSGSVARSLASRMRVITNDIQEYSRAICSASLQGSQKSRDAVRQHLTSAAFTNHLNDVLERHEGEVREEEELLRNIVSTRRTAVEKWKRFPGKIAKFSTEAEQIIKNYAVLYFTVRSACELQALSDFARTLPGEQETILMASILSAASRVSLTVGNQFAQPLSIVRPNGEVKENFVKKYLGARKVSVIKRVEDALQLYPCANKFSGDNICISMEDRAAVSMYGDLAHFLYLDPPYGREHYSRYYHVLEAIASGDYSIVKESRTKMLANRYQSPYSIRNKAEDTFISLLTLASNMSLPIAVSYVDETAGAAVTNRIMSINDVRRSIKTYYPNISEHVVSEQKYSQLNHLRGRTDSRISRELLIIGSRV